MDIGKLFNGIAVIVDNEIENKTSAIYKIKELITILYTWGKVKKQRHHF